MKRSSDEGKPFFVQISYYPLHEEQEASPATLLRVKSRPVGKIHHDYTVAAITEDLDSGVVDNEVDDIISEYLVSSYKIILSVSSK